MDGPGRTGLGPRVDFSWEISSAHFFSSPTPAVNAKSVSSLSRIPAIVVVMLLGFGLERDRTTIEFSGYEKVSRCSSDCGERPLNAYSVLCKSMELDLGLNGDINFEFGFFVSSKCERLSLDPEGIDWGSVYCSMPTDHQRKSSEYSSSHPSPQPISHFLYASITLLSDHTYNRKIFMGLSFKIVYSCVG